MHDDNYYAIYMWYHLMRLNDKAFQDMSPQQFGWLKHLRAWALNSWMTSIPGHKPSRMYEYDWLNVYICIQLQQQQQLRRQQHLCLNYLWHTPQLRQHDLTTSTTENNAYNFVYIYIYIFSHSFASFKISTT